MTVEVSYPGAPANIVETRITEIIEERIAGIEGIEFIASESQDGESNVAIEFVIDRDQAIPACKQAGMATQCVGRHEPE